MDKTLKVICALLCICAIALAEDISDIEESERSLYEHLFNSSRYNRRLRPRTIGEDGSDKVSLEMSLGLIQIFGIDEKEGILEIYIYIRQYWVDKRLAWNQADYGNIKTIAVIKDEVWTPDLVLFNSNDDINEKTGAFLVEINATGHMSWTPALRIRAQCALDLQNFPFDTQNCSLKFGSWAYTGYEVDIKLVNMSDGSQEVELGSYSVSPEWELIGHPAMRGEAIYQDIPNPFTLFSLVMKRRRSLVGFIIGPVIMISLLTSVVFLLPPRSSHKMALSAGLLVTDTLLMNSLMEYIGPDIQVPLIVIYHAACFFFIFLSIVLSAVTLNLAMGTCGKSPRATMRPITDSMIGRLMCLPARSVHTDEEKQVDHNDSLAFLQFAVFIDRLLFVTYLFCIFVFTIIFLSNA